MRYRLRWQYVGLSPNDPRRIGYLQIQSNGQSMTELMLTVPASDLAPFSRIQRVYTPFEEFVTNPLNPYVPIPGVYVNASYGTVPPIFDETWFAMVSTGLLTGVGVDVQITWEEWKL